MSEQLQYIEVSKLRPHPDNPRKALGDLTDLVESIKVHGVLQNLTVVPDVGNLTGEPTGTYTVVIGHRRLAAAKEAGLTAVPCVVSNMTGVQQIRTMLTENIQRADLTVYEQAQGFQLMLDLGDTVEQIAERAGFSETTVRRRLNIAKLDQALLKEVTDDVERQISMSDFDKLTQLEDMAARNECLKDIGTANFNHSVQNAVHDQEVKRKLPLVKAAAKKLGATKIKSCERWGGKYDEIGRVTWFTDWDGEAPLVPENEKRKLFYYMDEGYGSITFYVAHERAKPQKKSPEARALEERRNKAWADAKEQATLAYKLRSDFVKGLTVTNKNIHKMLKGAVSVSALKICYFATDSKVICELLNIENCYTVNRDLKVLAAFEALDEKSYPALIYAGLGDREDLRYTAGVTSTEFPHYTNNAQLNAIYDWLISLGYEMSDDEKAMRDGTHEIYKRGENA